MLNLTFFSPLQNGAAHLCDLSLIYIMLDDDNMTQMNTKNCELQNTRINMNDDMVG